MIELDLSPIPNQEFMMVLDRQSCVINIYQRAGRVYLDLFMDGEPVQVGSLLPVSYTHLTLPTIA